MPGWKWSAAGTGAVTWSAIISGCHGAVHWLGLTCWEKAAGERRKQRFHFQTPSFSVETLGRRKTWSRNNRQLVKRYVLSKQKTSLWPGKRIEMKMTFVQLVVNLGSHFKISTAPDLWSGAQSPADSNKTQHGIVMMMMCDQSSSSKWSRAYSALLSFCAIELSTAYVWEVKSEISFADRHVVSGRQETSEAGQKYCDRHRAECIIPQLTNKPLTLATTISNLHTTQTDRKWRDIYVSLLPTRETRVQITTRHRCAAMLCRAKENKTCERLRRNWISV